MADTDFSTVVTDDNIKDFFINLLDGENPDDDFIFDLLNQAREMIEEELQLEILKKIDTDEQTSATSSYTTEPISFPNDFFAPYTRTGIFVGEREFYPVPIEQREKFKFDNVRFTYDFANDQYFLMGKQTGGEIITFPYIKESPKLEAGGTNSLWPPRYRKLIAYESTVIYLGGVDSDDLNVLLVPEQRESARRLKRSMMSWDQRLKRASMAGRAGTFRRGANRESRLGTRRSGPTPIP